MLARRFSLTVCCLRWLRALTGSGDLSIRLRLLVGHFTRLRFPDRVVLVFTTAL
jgi:hypothetical protein